MMKNFDALSLDDRAGIVSEGNFLLSMDYYGFTLNLYILPNNFYAEVWYSIRERDIVDIRLSENGDFDKWLNRIDLSFR